MSGKTHLQNIWEIYCQSKIDEIELIIGSFRNSLKQNQVGEIAFVELDLDLIKQYHPEIEKIIKDALFLIKKIKDYKNDNYIYFTNDRTISHDSVEKENEIQRYLTTEACKELDEELFKLLDKPLVSNILTRKLIENIKLIDESYNINIGKIDGFKQRIDALEANDSRKIRTVRYKEDIDRIFKPASHRWLWAGIVYFIVFVLIILFSTVLSINTQNPIIQFSNNIFHIINIFQISPIQNDIERYIIRALFISIGLYGLLFIRNQYRINKNMEYVIRQKMLMAETYPEFVINIKDDIIKSEAAKAISSQLFTVNDTGYVVLPKSSENEINLPLANVMGDLIKNIQK